MSGPVDGRPPGTPFDRRGRTARAGGTTAGLALAFLAALCTSVLPTGTFAAESARVTGDTGSSLILLGAEQPPAPWYRVGPGARPAFPADHVGKHDVGPNQLLVQDRGLLPSRAFSNALFAGQGIDVVRDLPAFEVAQVPLVGGGASVTIMPRDRAPVAFAFAEPRVTGAPGSYALLLAADHTMIAGAFWIDPKIVLLFHSPAALLGPRLNDRVMVDRALLPTSISVPNRRLNLLIAYGALPPAPPPHGNSEPAMIAVSQTATGFIDPPRIDPPFATTFRWSGRADRDFAGRTIAAYAYDAENLFLPETQRIADGAVRRVYVPSLGLDLAAATWADAAEILVGEGSEKSSSDLALTAWLARDLTPELRACIETLRATTDYAAFDATMRDMERRNIPLLAAGSDDIVRFGAADYFELEERFGIMAAFVDCLAPPG